MAPKTRQKLQHEACMDNTGKPSAKMGRVEEPRNL